ncbi:pyrrolidone-carboxylate peptidase [Myxococcota bacterium]|nr:pyrrolidone-carboxylate peptidase [Myxococcota bacterium]
MILVTGFGPFLDVEDNPSGRLARRIDGARVAGHSVYGERLPVSYDEAPAMTLALAERLRPILVVGLGVARGRMKVMVERVGRRPDPGAIPDVGGRRPTARKGAPAEVRASLDVEALSDALGAAVSDDAGAYVCNAWLYTVARALPAVPVGFIHVPDEGMSEERLLTGLARLVTARVGA